MAVRTWESIWPDLLEQAAETAAQIRRDQSHELPLSAAAIILARTAWEAFINEFIEWRGLPEHLKRKNFENTLIEIHKVLRCPAPALVAGTLWGDLSLLNDLRNALVHHKASALSAGESPKDLLERLEALALLPAGCNERTWELSVLTSSTARWACHTVGQAIITLEEVPAQRRRSVDAVHRAVAEAMSALTLSLTNTSGG